MTVAERIVPALAAWAATGWVVAGHPTPAAADRAGPETIGPTTTGIAAHPASRVPEHPASGRSTVRPPGPGEPWRSGSHGQVVHDDRQGPGLVCTYRLRGVRKGGFLNVREGAGIHHAPVATLRRSDGNIAGACEATNGWVAVDTADGIPGWASARYLRRL